MLQGFLHFIWVGGLPTYGMWMGMRIWSDACMPSPMPSADDHVQPILWIDRVAHEAMQLHTDRQVYCLGLTELSVKLQRTSSLFRESGIQACGFMFGRYGQIIPIALLSENLLVFKRELLRRSGKLEWEFFEKNLFPAIAVESNPTIGGLPVLASDMLKLIILRFFGGIYVDAVGLTPLVTPITISNIENNVLNRFWNPLDPATSFVHSHIMMPTGLENYGLIVDISDPNATEFLEEMLLKYSAYFRRNPRHGILDRAIMLSYYNHKDHLSISEAVTFYLEILDEIQTLAERTTSHEVCLAHSCVAIQDEKPLIVQKFEEYNLGKVFENSIEFSGFASFPSILKEFYADKKGLSMISLQSRPPQFFGQTRLKGKDFSYNQPLIGHARNYWQASQKIVEYYLRKKIK